LVRPVWQPVSLTLELTPPREDVGATMSAVVGYHFEAERGWGAVVPEVFAGFEESLGKLSPFRLRAGVSFSGIPYGADSLDTFKSLAAPGSWSAGGLVYLMRSHVDASPLLLFIAVGAGIKQVAHGRNDLSDLIQHYVRFAGGVSLGRDRRLVVCAEFLRGWHGLTEESEEAFRTLFHSEETTIESVLITAPSRIRVSDSGSTSPGGRSRTGKRSTATRMADEAVSLGLRYDLDLP